MTRGQGSTSEAPAEDDVRWLVLHRVTWHSTATMPGSVVVMANCGHRAWIAPSGQQFLRTDEGRLAYSCCTDCMPREVLTDPGNWLGAVPGAADEFADVFGRGTADQILAYLRDNGIGS